MLRTTTILAFALFLPTAAQAQRVHGAVVEEETGFGIGAADVEVLAEDGTRLGSARTTRTGAFLIRLRRAGTVTLRVSHLGYADVQSQPVEIEAHETVSVVLRMASTAIPLEPLLVVGRADTRGVGGMQERMRRPGIDGHFITRDQIERRPNARATELLEGIPGVMLIPQGFAGSLGSLIQMRGIGLIAGRDGPAGEPSTSITHSPHDRCDPTIYIDGQRVSDQEITLDSFLRANLIEGIEVYTRGVSAPSPLLALNTCGVVAFWLRSGELDGFSWRRLGAWLGGMALIIGLASQ
jgi:hypothetical protein